MRTIILTLLTVSGACGKSLVVLQGRRSTASCCRDRDALSCVQASVDPTALEDSVVQLPGEISVNYVNRVPGHPNSYHYANSDADVVITHNPQTHTMHGHASLLNGRSFVLENCGNAGHVWKSYDVESFREREVGHGDLESHSPNRTRGIPNLGAGSDNLLKSGTVTFTVKIYYTPEVAAATADIDGFTDQVIAETNQGYANSEVPVMIVKHCVEQATITDLEAADSLTPFINMKSSVSELLGSADSAALLVLDNDYCGFARFDTLTFPVSVTRKSCATGYYSFGHELGHNLGLHHDPDTSTNFAYPGGHGHLIEKGSHTTGFRTIMAYHASGHSQRVNYYSNPNVVYSLTGTPTGVTGLSDNAAVLIQNVIAFSQIGDESETCGSSSDYCPIANRKIQLRRQGFKRGTADENACQDACRNAADKCQFWMFKVGSRVTLNRCFFFKLKVVGGVGFTSGPKECTPGIDEYIASLSVP